MRDIRLQREQDIQYVQSVMPVRGSFTIFSNLLKLQQIISRTPEVINCEDYRGRTLLAHAAELHNNEAIILLISINNFDNNQYRDKVGTAELSVLPYPTR